MESEDFDVIKIGKVFVDLEQSITKNGWIKETIDAYENLRSYVFSSDNFNTYYREKIEERLQKYMSSVETEQEKLSEQLKKIKKFIAKNLGSDGTTEAIELAKTVKDTIKSNDLDTLKSLNNQINNWFNTNESDKKQMAVSQKTEQRKLKDEKKQVTDIKNVDIAGHKKDLSSAYALLRRLEVCRNFEVILGSKFRNSEKIVKSYDKFLRKNFGKENFDGVKENGIRRENEEMGEVYAQLQFAYDMGGNLRQGDFIGFCNLAYTAIQMIKREVLDK